MKKLILLMQSVLLLYLGQNFNANAAETTAPKNNEVCQIAISSLGPNYNFNFCVSYNGRGAVMAHVSTVAAGAASLNASTPPQYQVTASVVGSGVEFINSALTSDSMVFGVVPQMGQQVTFTLSGGGQWVTPGGLRWPTMVIQPTTVTIPLTP